ncbi:MAG: hypothetical protein MR874_01075 [Coriobacteriaceae bacterium]|nr:hypothetical protein [Coriobacteriaceae bacterium]MCI6843340.1 hypothetical protein [Coriobacteriaceae bacterium]
MEDLNAVGIGGSSGPALARERLAGAVASVLWESDPTGALGLALGLGSVTCALDLVALDVSDALSDPERAARLASDLEWIAANGDDDRVAERAAGLARVVGGGWAPPTLDEEGPGR